MRGSRTILPLTLWAALVFLSVPSLLEAQACAGYEGETGGTSMVVFVGVAPRGSPLEELQYSGVAVNRRASELVSLGGAVRVPFGSAEPPHEGYVASLGSSYRFQTTPIEQCITGYINYDEAPEGHRSHLSGSLGYGLGYSRATSEESDAISVFAIPSVLVDRRAMAPAGESETRIRFFADLGLIVTGGLPGYTMVAFRSLFLGHPTVEVGWGFSL